VAYNIPAILGEDGNPVMRIEIAISGDKEVTLNHLVLDLSSRFSGHGIAALRVDYMGADFEGDRPNSNELEEFGVGAFDGQSVVVSGSHELPPGHHYFEVSIGLADDVDLGSLFICHLTRVQVGEK